MNEKISDPHDKYFKEIFSKKEAVRDFIEEYLPKKLSLGMDLDSLEIVKDSFVDKELSEHFSDILYKIQKENDHSYLYFLMEHKSYGDQWVWFQLLRYMVNIWDLYLKQNKSEKYLPVITPVVIYHGKEKWNRGNSLASLFQTTDDTKNYIPDFHCEMVDLTAISDDEIKGELTLKIHFLIMKYSHNPQLYEKLSKILKLVDDQLVKSGSTEFLETFLRYLTSIIDQNKIEEVEHQVVQSLKSGDQYMSTIAEKWFQEGVEKGIEKGIEKGKCDTAIQLIKMGMNDEVIHNATGLNVGKIEELRKQAICPVSAV
jgi:predicted transposase/invertase (TIGR01784 family)